MALGKESKGMEYEVVYEISKHPFPSDTVAMGLLTIAFLFFCLVCVAECWEKRDFDFIDIVKILGTLILGIITAESFISSFTYGGSVKAEYAKEYYAGRYSVIECVVEEYGFSNTGIVCFDAEGKHFSMNYFLKNPIPLNREIRVSYVPDGNGEYCIVKVEVRKE